LESTFKMYSQLYGQGGKFQFLFDGEDLAGGISATDADLEDGDLIDVKQAKH
jgi:hypothetical protein